MMHSHPLKTFKIQRECNKCDEKKKKMDNTRWRVKAKLKELNESVQRLKKQKEKVETASSSGCDEPGVDSPSVRSTE
jgi:hypothetical protein